MYRALQVAISWHEFLQTSKRRRNRVWSRLDVDLGSVGRSTKGAGSARSPRPSTCRMLSSDGKPACFGLQVGSTATRRARRPTGLGKKPVPLRDAAPSGILVWQVRSSHGPVSVRRPPPGHLPSPPPRPFLPLPLPFASAAPSPLLPRRFSSAMTRSARWCSCLEWSVASEVSHDGARSV